MNTKRLGNKDNGHTLHDGGTIHIDRSTQWNRETRNLTRNTNLVS